MQVVPPDNDSPHHLSAVASTSKDATPNRDIASEGAFLVDVSTCNRSYATKTQKHPQYNISSIDYSCGAPICFTQIGKKKGSTKYLLFFF